MNLLERTNSKITKNRNDVNLPHLEIIEVILVYCNIANNNYQHNSKVWYRFIPNKLFGQLLDLLFKNIIFLKTFNSEFSVIKVWFIDQSSKALDTEDKINITLVIN